MKKEYTDVTILLDRSGSMSTIKDDMEGGFNTFIDEQKKIPGTLKVSLYQFDNDFDTVYVEKDIMDIPPLNLVPRSSTALLDSAYRAITLTGERLKAKPESERPNNVIFVIITDGMENASREVTSSQLKDLIEQQTNEYRWTFTYLGANQDAFSVGSSIGISTSNIVNYSSSGESTRSAYNTISVALTRSRKGDVTNSGGFYEEDEQDLTDGTS